MGLAADLGHPRIRIGFRLHTADAAATPAGWNRGTDVGLVLLRFAVGRVFFAHGTQKVFAPRP